MYESALAIVRGCCTRYIVSHRPIYMWRSIHTRVFTFAVIISPESPPGPETPRLLSPHRARSLPKTLASDIIIMSEYLFANVIQFIWPPFNVAGRSRAADYRVRPFVYRRRVISAGVWSTCARVLWHLKFASENCERFVQRTTHTHTHTSTPPNISLK